MSGGPIFLLVVAAALAGLGAFGMMARRNAFTVLCSAQLLLLAAAVGVIDLAAFGTPAPGRPPAAVLAMVLSITALAAVAAALSLTRRAGPLTSVDDAAADEA